MMEIVKMQKKGRVGTRCIYIIIKQIQKPMGTKAQTDICCAKVLPKIAGIGHSAEGTPREHLIMFISMMLLFQTFGNYLQALIIQYTVIPKRILDF